MSARAIPATKGMRGFDCNTPITAIEATLFVRAGFSFCLRYVPRESSSANDLTVGELAHLWAAGLAVMPVQHVEAGEWTPTDEKGQRYGACAASTARALGFPAGTTVWLDLESVSTATSSDEVIRYANLWYDQVAAAGFQPGLYVGWHCGLGPTALHARLKFERYWSSYNLDADECPAVCGVCMRQGTEERPTSELFVVDPDVITGDALGRFPTLAFPPQP